MHNNLDPEKIEDLLRSVPKIEDMRSKEDILARLKADGVFDETVKEPKQEIVKPMKKSLPFFKIASFVALFVLIIFIPTLMINKDNSWFNSANDLDSAKSSSAKQEKSEDKDFEEESSIMSAETQDHSVSMLRMADYRTGLYEDELGDEFVFRIGLASNAAESIPISMKIPSSFLQENGLSSNASYLQIYELIAPLLDEEALGFTEYHPFVGRFEENGNQLIHYLPDDHSYDLASAAISKYIGALNDTFGAHYKEVLLRTENGGDIEFSGVGEMKEPVVINNLDNRMNYFLLEQEEGTRYLSPNFRKEYATLTDAFAALKHESNDFYKSAMIDEIDFSLENRETYTAVIFKEPLNVTVYEVNELMHMLEAIIATAASFDEQVKFENVMQEEWGGFWFNEVIPKLMGVNEISFPLQ